MDRIGVKRSVALAAAIVAVLAAGRAGVFGQSGQFTDQRGKSFAFPRPAQRVVTIAIPLFWTFMTVDGSASRLVGANPVASSQMRAGIVDRVFPGASSI